jgi:hypothetical protein
MSIFDSTVVREYRRNILIDLAAMKKNENSCNGSEERRLPLL